MPSGQRTLPLVWLPLLSSTSPILSEPVCLRTSSRKRSKQSPSTCGRNSTTQVPLTGSTAAYSQNQWYWWSCTHGGRLPNGHHSRRCVTFRPNRGWGPSAPCPSMAKTRCTASRDTVACSSFFPERQSLLGGGILSFQLAQISFRISSEAASSGSLQAACCDVGAHRLPAGPIDSGQIAGVQRCEV